MAPHGLSSTKKKSRVSTKSQNTVAYQTGVDVLGFPIYMQHTVYSGETKGTKINPKKEPWITVEEKIIKQH